jgi:2-keto-3-deoxy-L-rhamnonate aldolase RhmA
MTSRYPAYDPTEFRRRMLNREPVVGSFLKFTVPQVTEIYGHVGYDFVILDEEHAPWTREQLGVAYLGARAFGTAAITRVSRPDAASILSCLDDGATGVMVPHVSTPEMARNVASWARYKGGTRGSGVSRMGDYGGRVGENGGIDGYYQWADSVTTVIGMIEDASALDHIDEITAVEGIDCFFMGRGDLGLSLSNAGPKAPSLVEATNIIAESVLKNGKVLAALSPSLDSDDARAMKELGVTVVYVGNDTGFLRAGATAQYNNFRKLYY